jgi:Sec-independent protein secretion pathway component TatC
MFVLAGLLTYLLVVADQLIALVIAIPLIAVVIWAAFRPNLGRARR